MSFTFQYGILDYSTPENSLLASYSDDSRWFLYGPHITNQINTQSSIYYWIDNWNNLWEQICNPVLGLTMRQIVKGFSTPLSDQCIDYIVSNKLILGSALPHYVQQLTHQYITMIRENELLKETISNLEINHTLELEAAGQLIDALTAECEKEQPVQYAENEPLYRSLDAENPRCTCESNLLIMEPDLLIFET